MSTFWFHHRDSVDKNLLHGFERDCSCSEEKEISGIGFKTCEEASKMRTLLETIRCIEGVNNIVQPMFITIFKKKFVLVTKRVPDTNFESWLANELPSDEEKKIFFKHLFSSVSKVHQSGISFGGNLRAGLRIENNIPFLIIKQSIIEELDMGIYADLQEIRQMVSDSFLNDSEETELFTKLCQHFVPLYIRDLADLRSHTVNLQDASLLILHSPLVWDERDRYSFIKKLGEYRDYAQSAYENLTSDYICPAIPRSESSTVSIDWWSRLLKLNLNNDERLLYRTYNYDPSLSAYRMSESIRYLHRCFYEHPPSNQSFDVPRLSRVLYNVYPEAPSKLYWMMVCRLYHKDIWLNSNSRFFHGSSSMPNILEFLMARSNIL